MSEYTKDQIEIIKSELSPVNTTDLYVEMLDDCYEPVKIAGYEYSVSSALQAVDPTAFRCGVTDYIDSLVGETLTDEIDGEHYLLKDVSDLIESILENEKEV